MSIYAFLFNVETWDSNLFISAFIIGSLSIFDFFNSFIWLFKESISLITDSFFTVNKTSPSLTIFPFVTFNLLISPSVGMLNSLDFVGSITPFINIFSLSAIV